MKPGDLVRIYWEWNTQYHEKVALVVARGSHETFDVLIPGIGVRTFVDEALELVHLAEGDPCNPATGMV